MVELHTLDRLHPTAQKLVDTVKEMLNDNAYNEIKSENVFARSGISRGSMYHHFSNFDELIQTAQWQLYQSFSIGMIAALEQATLDVDDIEVLRENLTLMINASALERSLTLRRQCVGYFYNVSSVKSFRSRTLTSQEILNQRWIRLYQSCLDRGWADPLVDSRAFALMMQSMIVGRVIDDVSPVHVDLEAWVRIGILLVEKFCLANAGKC